MHCRKCGKEIADSATECVFCGAAVSDPSREQKTVQAASGDFAIKTILLRALGILVLIGSVFSAMYICIVYWKVHIPKMINNVDYGGDQVNLPALGGAFGLLAFGIICYLLFVIIADIADDVRAMKR